MRPLLIALIALAASGCFTSPTAPDCVTLKREELQQVVTVNGRIYFVSVVAPKTTTCK